MEPPVDKSKLKGSSDINLHRKSSSKQKIDVNVSKVEGSASQNEFNLQEEKPESFVIDEKFGQGHFGAKASSHQ